MTQDLIQLFKRDLEKLMDELEAYPTEASLWLVAGEIKNSAGNLALHLIGNLNQFIGVDMGGTDFKRDREAEFSAKNLARAVLIGQLKDTSVMIETVLNGLNAEFLELEFSKKILGYPMTHRYFLLHLYGHLNWHLGQISYHRRVIGGVT
jgi:hypothetical protein